MRVMVLGGTGVISRAIVEVLLEEGHEVTVFNRGRKALPFKGNVELVTGDKSNREEFEAGMKGRHFDAVIDMISFTKGDAESTYRAFSGNIGQLIICSTGNAYARPFREIPIREDFRLTEDPVFPYPYLKVKMEEALPEASQKHGIPFTIIRPSLTYGIGSANIGVLRQNYGILDRIRKGKPLVMFGDGTNPWIFSFAPDIAKAFTGAVGNKNTYGQAYHATSDEMHIFEDLYTEIGRISGVEPIIKHISTDLLMKGFPEMFSHIYYEKMHAGIFDNSKIKRDIPGFNPKITLAEGMKTIFDWMEGEGGIVDPVKDALEDRLVALHQRWSGDMEELGRIVAGGS